MDLLVSCLACFCCCYSKVTRSGHVCSFRKQSSKRSRAVQQCFYSPRARARVPYNTQQRRQGDKETIRHARRLLSANLLALLRFNFSDSTCDSAADRGVARDLRPTYYSCHPHGSIVDRNHMAITCWMLTLRSPHLIRSVQVAVCLLKKNLISLSCANPFVVHL